MDTTPTTITTTSNTPPPSTFYTLHASLANSLKSLLSQHADTPPASPTSPSHSSHGHGHGHSHNHAQSSRARHYAAALAAWRASRRARTVSMFEGFLDEEEEEDEEETAKEKEEGEEGEATGGDNRVQAEERWRREALLDPNDGVEARFAPRRSWWGEQEYEPLLRKTLSTPVPRPTSCSLDGACLRDVWLRGSVVAATGLALLLVVPL